MAVIEMRSVKRVFRNALTPHETTVAFYLPRLDIGEGERWALTGPSGCGKSTLLQLMAGLIRPDAGTICVAGNRLDQLSGVERDRLRGRQIGFVFQDHNLVSSLSAIDNVMLGLRFGRTIPRIQWGARAREMLDKVSLGHRRHWLPDRLSVGERQRVAVARALVNQPPLLFADEPTASLDPGTARQVFGLLLSLCDEGAYTLVVVTHDESIAARLTHRLDCSSFIHESDSRQ